VVQRFEQFCRWHYSTLWGDGALGELPISRSAAWNYPLMAAAYWLALLPTAAAVIGGILI